MKEGSDCWRAWWRRIVSSWGRSSVGEVAESSVASAALLSPPSAAALSSFSSPINAATSLSSGVASLRIWVDMLMTLTTSTPPPPPVTLRKKDKREGLLCWSGGGSFLSESGFRDTHSLLPDSPADSSTISLPEQTLL
jgi:hypothetical protein